MDTSVSVLAGPPNVKPPPADDEEDGGFDADVFVCPKPEPALPNVNDGPAVLESLPAEELLLNPPKETFFCWGSPPCSTSSLTSRFCFAFKVAIEGVVLPKENAGAVEEALLAFPKPVKPEDEVAASVLLSSFPDSVGTVVLLFDELLAWPKENTGFFASVALTACSELCEG